MSRKGGSEVSGNKSAVRDYILITLGAIIYGIGTVMFIFPSGALMGGTTGIAMIVSRYIPLAAGNVSVILNSTLIVAAFFLLGKEMAVRSFAGSLMTTVAIGVFEPIFGLIAPGTVNSLLFAVLGATLIAVASGIMFYVDSSSGGTDILALIVKKFVNIKVGFALMLTDVLIVVVGVLLSQSLVITVSSLLGFFIKVIGIDAVIGIIKRLNKRKK